MEVSFRGGTFAKENTRYVLVTSCWITFECKSDAGCLWYLGCKGRRDGMKVMLDRSKVLHKKRLMSKQTE